MDTVLAKQQLISQIKEWRSDEFVEMKIEGYVSMWVVCGHLADKLVKSEEKDDMKTQLDQFTRGIMTEANEINKHDNCNRGRFIRSKRVNDTSKALLTLVSKLESNYETLAKNPLGLLQLH